MYLLGAIDKFFEAKVRNEFLFQMEKGHGEFTDCYVIGINAREGRVPGFHVILHNGACWTHLPLHAICFTESKPIHLSELCWWDCFSETFTITTLPVLGRCVTMSRTGQKRQGTYLMTIDWEGKFADIPDQHKQHHLIKLDSGHLAAYPNNKIIWHDSSFIEPLQGNPGYKVQNTEWSVEKYTEQLQSLEDWLYDHKA